ncbi:GNAT family N-acetyltransferase [Natronospora cellulosivora (SeqCode)]
MSLNNNYILYKDYKDIDWLREEFFDFTKKIFGLSFKEWYEYGFWGDNYRCYSLVDNKRVISNISLSELDLIVNGEEKKAIQLATVGTLDEYRGKGLSRYLMDMVLEDYKEKCDFVFLSANDSVVDFYPRFGFKRTAEYKFTSSIDQIVSKKDILDNNSVDTGLKTSAIRKLDFNNDVDLKIIKRLFEERTFLSKRLFIKNYFSILMWYLVNFYRDSIWYLEKEDIIIIYQVEDDTLHLFDIISKEMPILADLMQYFDLKNVEKVRYHFTPELLGVGFESNAILTEDPFFVQGDFGLDGKEFKIPQLAQT